MSDPALIRDAILEAAARALANATEWSSFWDGHDARQLARAVLAAVTPLIRADTLERAAKVAEEYDGRGIDEDYAALTCDEIATRIRALKEQP